MASGIGRADFRPFRQKAPDHFDRGRKANIIRVRLERDPQDADLFPLHHPQRFLHFLQETIHALLVHPLGFLQQSEIHARAIGQLDERLNIFRQTKSAESQPRLQKLPADSRIETHGARHFLHVAAQPLAQIRQHVRV